MTSFFRMAAIPALNFKGTNESYLSVVFVRYYENFFQLIQQLIKMHTNLVNV